jgi:hypothetical protein
MELTSFDVDRKDIVPGNLERAGAVIDFHWEPNVSGK